MNSLSIAGVVPASQLERPAPLTVPFGIAEIDALTGGIPRGSLTEICGPASSGRTSLLFSVVAQMTGRREICALVDAGNSFDPHSAAAAGIDLDRLLWVRCSGGQRWSTGKQTQSNRGSTRINTDQLKIQNSKFKIARERRLHWLGRIEQALKATDLLLQGGGFGLVVIDLADVPTEAARRVPLASWFRFRRAVEHTPTALVILEQEPYAKTCASLVLRTAASRQHSAVRKTAQENSTHASGIPPHAQLFSGIVVEVEVLRSRVDAPGKKPPRPSGARFQTRAEWA